MNRPTIVSSMEALDAAHRVQLAVVDLWKYHGHDVGGWKVAFTSPDSRPQSVDRYPPFGYVLRSRIYPSGVTLDFDVGYPRRVEPEICLILGSTLGGPEVDERAARTAVDGVAAAFEVVHERRRASDTPLSVRIADGINNWGMVVSEPVEPPKWDLRATVVTTTADGRTVGVVDPAMHGIDDPYHSLARLARSLNRYGRRLEAGDRVITGAFSVHDVDSPGTWVADFSGIGRVGVTFAHPARPAASVP